MTGLVRKATLLLSACGLMAAAVATANVPSPANSDKPDYILVVGTAGGTSDPTGTFTITVRDAGNNAIANSLVVLDFGACTDLRLCTDQDQTTGPKTVDCPTATLRGYTDVNGEITFTVIGAANNQGNSPGPSDPNAGCVNITADGISLIHAQSVDMDNNGADPILGTVGADGTDVSVVQDDVGSGFYYGRSDFDYTEGAGSAGVLSGVDVSFLMDMVGSGLSADGCTVTYCP